MTNATEAPVGGRLVKLAVRHTKLESGFEIVMYICKRCICSNGSENLDL